MEYKNINYKCPCMYLNLNFISNDITCDIFVVTIHYCITRYTDHVSHFPVNLNNLFKVYIVIICLSSIILKMYQYSEWYIIYHRDGFRNNQS